MSKSQVWRAAEERPVIVALPAAATDWEQRLGLRGDGLPCRAYLRAPM